MNRIFRTAVSIFTFTAIVFASNATADQPASNDYAGLPVAEVALGFSLPTQVASSDFAALEASEKNPGCDAIEGQFDYAGLQEVQCSTSAPQEEPEWSYLY
jgi:hypothetical protein